MISLLGKINIIDNSGAKRVQLIKVLNNRKVGVAGDYIIVVAKKVKPKGKVQRGQIKRALIVRTRKETIQRDGSLIRFKTNAAIIVKRFGIKNKWVPFGTRFKGYVTTRLFNKKHMKIKSLTRASIK